MKFGKTLTREAVPEWKTKYLDYRGLKKKLTRIKEELLTLTSITNTTESFTTVPSPSTSPSHPNVALLLSNSSTSSTSSSSNTAFTSKWTSSSLSSIDSESKLVFPSSESLQPSPSLIPPRTEPSLTFTDKHQASVEHNIQDSPLTIITSVKKPSLSIDPPQRSSLLRKASILTGIGSRRKSKSPNRQVDMTLGFDDALNLRTNSEKAFFKMLDEELEKIGEFFLLQKQKALETMYNIKLQIRAQGHQSLNEEGNKISRFLPTPNNIFPFKFKKNQLKDAMLEYYRGLNLLRNFQIVNYTGIIKILKKFDKTVDWPSTQSYLSSRQDKLFWERDKCFQDLIKEVEHMYCKCFTEGKRQKGMQQLRLPDMNLNTYQTVTWLSGFCLGAGFMLLILSLIDIGHYETYKAEYFIPLVLVYGGFFMPIFFSIAFVYALYVWSTHAINYTFIFELDPRDHIHYLQFMLFPSFLFLAWSIFFFLNFTHHSEALSIPVFLLPLVYFFSCVLFFINPLPMFYRNARLWLIRASTRILLSPFHKISFSDFFLTDILCSLLFSLTSLPLFLCISFRQDPQCDTSKSFFTFAFALIPPMLRLVQCLRRFYDTQFKHPHLTNGFKYFLNCLVIVTSFFQRKTENSGWFGSWIGMSVVATMYSLAWDLIMDWGVLQPNYQFVREQTTFSPLLIYYVSIVLNSVLRLSWVLQVSPGYWLPIPSISAVTLVCAFLESLRRVHWCIYRMENEHLYNCGQFRAVKDIPLPRLPTLQREEEEDEEDGETMEIKMHPLASSNPSHISVPKLK